MAAGSHFEWLEDWSPLRDRDPLRILAKAEAGRDPELVRKRKENMTTGGVSTFFRGSAGVMAADLGADRSRATGLTVDVNGDAHLGNFGMYGSPERVRVFDLNDFDEARPGPWEWDVCRLAASAVITERDVGGGEEEQAETARNAVMAYAEAAARLARGRRIDRWYRMTRCESIDAGDLALDPAAAGSNELLALAGQLLEADEKRTQERTVDKLTDDGEFNTDDGKQEPIDGERADKVRGSFDAYCETITPGLRRLVGGYRPTAVASRPSGQGSLGLRTYLLLVVGGGAKDALILQVKEATPSQLEFALAPQAAGHEGQRVVDLQRTMQGASDPLLGWVSIDTEQYYVRQFRDMKDAPDVTKDKFGHQHRVALARLCGTTLARAHARTAQKTGIAEVSGRIEDDREAFGKAVVSFARAYADVSRADQELLRTHD